MGIMAIPLDSKPGLNTNFSNTEWLNVKTYSFIVLFVFIILFVIISYVKVLLTKELA